MTTHQQLLKREIFGRYHNLQYACPSYMLDTFECSKDDKHFLLNKDCSDCPGYQCRFCPIQGYGHLAMIAKEDGFVEILNIETESNTDAIIDRYQGHSNCIFDVQWTSLNNFLTCSGDSTIKFHDLQTKKVLQQFVGHQASVKAITLNPSNPHLFASSSRDNSILFWDSRISYKSTNDSEISNHKSLNGIYSAHLYNCLEGISKFSNDKKRKSVVQTGHKSVTGIIYSNENTLISSGSSDGRIKMWDVRKLGSIGSSSKSQAITPVRHIDYDPNLLTDRNPPGYTDVICDSASRMLFANCRDGFIYQYDLKSVTDKSDGLVMRYGGHTGKTFYVKLDICPFDEAYIAVGSSSNTPYIYRIGQIPQRPLTLNGHNGEVTVARWSPSNPGAIVTVSDDCMVLVHRMKLNSPAQLSSEVRSKLNINLDNTLAMSSRTGHETVNWSNQRKPRKFTLNESITELNSSKLTSSTSSSDINTTKKLKTPNLSKFFSTSTSISTQSPLQTILSSSSNNKSSPNLSQTRLDRSQSLLQNKQRILKESNILLSHLIRTPSKRVQPDEDDEENSENIPPSSFQTAQHSERHHSNIKRRKTVLINKKNYPSILSFLNDN